MCAGWYCEKLIGNGVEAGKPPVSGSPQMSGYVHKSAASCFYFRCWPALTPCSPHHMKCSHYPAITFFVSKVEPTRLNVPHILQHILGNVQRIFIALDCAIQRRNLCKYKLSFGSIVRPMFGVGLPKNEAILHHLPQHSECAFFLQIHRTWLFLKARWASHSVLCCPLLNLYVPRTWAAT